MRLAHLHIPHPIPYTHSLRLQEALLERNFLYSNAVLQAKRGAQPATNDSKAVLTPSPTLLTFQTHPTYTVGRRHLKSNPLSQSQIDFLTTNTSLNPQSATSPDLAKDRWSHALSPTPGQGQQQDDQSRAQLATFYPSPRGGLLTYHAPGQLTAYLIYNLRQHSITPRCHIRVLENAVIKTCARHGVSNTMTTEDPGVWIGDLKKTIPSKNRASVNDDNSKSNVSNVVACGNRDGEMTPTTRKICAIGVHVSRGITSHGIGLNVFDAPMTSDNDNNPYPAVVSQSHHQSSSSSPSSNHPSGQQDQSPSPNTTNSCQQGYLSWGFNRIVACGLEGKSVTWLSRERTTTTTATDTKSQTSTTTIGMSDVANTLAQEICKSMSERGTIPLDPEDILQITEQDILHSSSSSSSSFVS